jgi:hypothetical protein
VDPHISRQRTVGLNLYGKLEPTPDHAPAAAAPVQNGRSAVFQPLSQSAGGGPLSELDPLRSWALPGSWRSLIPAIDFGGGQGQHGEIFRRIAVGADLPPFLSPGGMSSTHLETLELRYEAITWKYTEGNIIYRDSWKTVVNLTFSRMILKYSASIPVSRMRYILIVAFFIVRPSQTALYKSVKFTTVAPFLSPGGMSSTHLETLELRYEAITWKYLFPECGTS